MEQVRNEQTIYSAAVYCRLSKDDEQAGESVSAEDLAAQTNTSVYATNSAVNYSTNPLTGALYPRRSFWDRFFGRNDWQVYGGN